MVITPKMIYTAGALGLGAMGLLLVLGFKDYVVGLPMVGLSFWILSVLYKGRF